MTDLFAVRPVAALTFEVSKGAYERALQSRGYDPPASCAFDCTILSDVAVDPQYCSSTGGLAHGYDAVVSITKPPALAGVAGTGSACAFDQARRPLWLVLAWHSSIVGMGSQPFLSQVAEHRAFVRHELLHGLGFVNSMFFYARDSRGERKDLIELRQVTDVDGATDEVWHFVRGRAYELAKAYFECDGNATAANAERTWDGLPLMGLPEAGRGAHWETRIMRDDVLSYGFRDAISSITLAAMEDLGHYLANYSNAECMNWGRAQGCQYVRSRCGIGKHDQSTYLGSGGASQCYGDEFWGDHVDSYLVQKCMGGNDPCSTTTKSGYESPIVLADGSVGARCDAQCHIGWRADCTNAPTSDPEGSLLSDLYDVLGSIEWESWVIPLLVMFFLCSLTSYLRKCLCAIEKSRSVALVLCGALWLISSPALAGAGYLYIEYPIYAAFVNFETVYCLAILSGINLLFSMAMLVALAWHTELPLKVGAYIMIVSIFVQFIGLIIVAYWVHALSGVPSDALVSMLGKAHRHVNDWLSDIFEQPVSIAEGLVCKTYQYCCRDNAFAIIERANEEEVGTVVVEGVDASGNTTNSSSVGMVHVVPTATNVTHCLASPQHVGATTDFELTMQDPSTVNFCEYTSGAPRSFLINPPPGTCKLVQRYAKDDGFSLDTCRADFCKLGTDGYLAFLKMFTDLIYRYSVPLTCAATFFLVFQLVLAVNLRKAATFHKRERRKRQAKEANKGQQRQGGSPKPVEQAKAKPKGIKKLQQSFGSIRQIMYKSNRNVNRTAHPPNLGDTMQHATFSSDTVYSHNV